jgi:hypothetical protein
VVATTVLAASGLFAASLDQRGAPLTAHRAFLDSEYANAATMEPFEYYGARWVAGLPHPAAFACASDAGRRSVVELTGALPHAEIASVDERRYFVFSPERRRELWTRMQNAGWRPVAEFAGAPTPARVMLSSLLQRAPGRVGGLVTISRVPRLLVMEHSSAPVPRPDGLLTP